MPAVICPYCGSPADLVDSAIVYGRSYGLIYLCPGYPACDSRVGVHTGTTQPLGRMANAELRHWKQKAHKAFDPLWRRKLERGGKGWSRAQMYTWLARQLNIPERAAHIGQMDVEMCRRVVEVCEKRVKVKP